jgi:hypothetical protein
MTFMIYIALLLSLFGGNLEAEILFQPTGKFPEGARQPRLIVLATGSNRALSLSMHRCTYDNGSEIGRDGWVRWVRTHITVSDCDNIHLSTQYW